MVVVSDTHLSSRAPEAAANWEAVVAYVGTSEPDLVVHLGDLTLDGARHPDEIDEARQLLDRLPSPWKAIPGNHDIGDNPREGEHPGEAITAARRDHWVHTLGADWWSLEVGAWTLVALDAQLLGSGLDAEANQRQWLAATLAAAVEAGRSVALLIHKPLTAPAGELAAAPPYRFVPAPFVDDLNSLLSPGRVPLVVSGHVHQYRELEAGGRRHAWAPTTWAVLPDAVQPVFGAKRAGVLTLELNDDGSFTVAPVEPPGLRQITVGVDVANPYLT